jgi:site-specific DNA-methyltransferase (adenine-specific)
MAWRLITGDCLEVLRAMGSASVDSAVCDPPAAISFMNKEFDRDRGGREQWVAWLARIMRQCLRVLKPGGYAVVWSLPRTSHWTAWAIESAGFEIRDVGRCLSGQPYLFHLYGSGFPKSLNVSKVIDSHLGVQRASGFPYRTTPASPEAAAWDGYGTALKPAYEPWVLARKPLVDTVAGNVLTYGTGGLNIEGCRIRTGVADPTFNKNSHTDGGFGHAGAQIYRAGGSGSETYDPHKGRWPANLVLVHDVRCTRVTEHRTHEGRTQVRRRWVCAPGCPIAELDRQSGTRTSGKLEPHHVRGSARLGHGGVYGDDPGKDSASAGRTFGGDSGGASRFFPRFSPSPPADDPIVPFLYCPKPSRRERDAGCDQLPRKSAGETTGGRAEGSAGLQSPRAGAGRLSGALNHHPTVKSVALMRWICRLVTPPGGTVLDPFAGSGTTGCAALRERFDFVGVEQDPEYATVARQRLIHHSLRP